MEISEILAHIALAAIAVGFCLRDTVQMRIAFIAAALLGVIAATLGWGLPPEALTIWFAVFAAINGAMLLLFQKDRSTKGFNEYEYKMYRNVFSKLSPGKFRQLIEAGEWRNINEGDVLIEEGVVSNEIFYIVFGAASVDTGGRHIATLRDGAFAGEMSFTTGKKTSARVTALRSMRCLVWSNMRLQEVMENDKDIRTELHGIFNTDIMTKMYKTISGEQTAS